MVSIIFQVLFLKISIRSFNFVSNLIPMKSFKINFFLLDVFNFLDFLLQLIFASYLKEAYVVKSANSMHRLGNTALIS